MAESGTTKRALAEALKTLMQERPLSAITVGDICGQCHMNRKSFYYHFRDKFDLVIWIFCTGFSDACPATEDASGDTLLVLCRFLAADRAFYRAALKVEGQNSFHEYLAELLRPILRDRLFPRLGHDPAFDFFLDLYVDLYRSQITHWVLTGCKLDPDQFIRLLYRAGASLGDTVPLPRAI